MTFIKEKLKKASRRIHLSEVVSLIFFNFFSKISRICCVYSLKDPALERTMQKYYWDEEGRRHRKTWR